MGEYADNALAYYARSRGAGDLFEDRYRPRYRNVKREKRNMADKTIVIRGEVYWAKLTGDARPYTGNPKYDKGPSWSVDITPDANSRKKIAAAGISDKLREGKGEKETRKETFLTLRQLLNRPDGKHNLPPKVKDASGRPWGDTEIGNGSIMDIMVRVRDYGDTTGVYYVEGMVLRHVPYESTGLEPLSEDDEFFGGTQEVTPQGDSAGAAPNADDLDEDIPF